MVEDPDSLLHRSTRNKRKLQDYQTDGSSAAPGDFSREPGVRADAAVPAGYGYGRLVKPCWTASRTPLIKDGESSLPNRLAISTASLIATWAGTSAAKSNS